MAAPTTHAALRTRVLALVTELDELSAAAYTLSFTGTATQQAGASGLSRELRDHHKAVVKSGFGALTSQLL